jgi:transposase
MRCEYLPPYSPDFNPIELAFSKVKANIRRNYALYDAATEGDDDLDAYILLHEAIWSVSAQDADGYWRKCRYTN